jgi:membrane protease subunit HflC
MNKLVYVAAAIAILVIILFGSGALYTIDQTKQVVITQFGEPIGEPITMAGLHFKLPFIRHANYFEKRVLQWDGDPNQVPTKDKRYIWVDTTARWRIKDPLKFLQSVTNETGAHARLDDIVDSATRDNITSHKLVELVRNSNRLLDESADRITDPDAVSIDEELEKINIGREALTRSILNDASKIVPQYGIELIDVRIKRINYVIEVQKKVFERMISERKRAAEKYRSEGQGKKAEIEGQMIKELKQITSQAYRIAETKKGKADAEAIKIYASAYNQDPEFYGFTKTLDTYKNTIDKDTVMILSADSEYFEYLKSIQPK